jgi:hypothetical protein
MSQNKNQKRDFAADTKAKFADDLKQDFMIYCKHVINPSPAAMLEVAWGTVRRYSLKYQQLADRSEWETLAYQTAEAFINQRPVRVAAAHSAVLAA